MLPENSVRRRGVRFKLHCTTSGGFGLDENLPPSSKVLVYALILFVKHRRKCKHIRVKQSLVWLRQYAWPVCVLTQERRRLIDIGRRLVRSDLYSSRVVLKSRFDLVLHEIDTTKVTEGVVVGRVEQNSLLIVDRGLVKVAHEHVVHPHGVRRTGVRWIERRGLFDFSPGDLIECTAGSIESGRVLDVAGTGIAAESVDRFIQ